MAHPLTSGNSVADASQFTTAQIQPTASALVLVFVTNVRPVISFGTLATPTVSGCGLTWEPVVSVTTPDGDRRLSCFRGMGTGPSRDALVINFDQNQDICAWSVLEYTDVDTGGVNGAGAIAQRQSATGAGTSLNVTVAPADPARERTVGAVVLEPTDGQPHPVSSGSGFSEIHQQTPTQPFGKGVTLQSQDASPGATKVAWSWTGSQNAVAVVIGVKAAPLPGTSQPSTDPTQTLVRRFEPILHLHPDESFFPVNAKRYVENAALWAAVPPFDDKNSWGTQPLVKAGQLAAAQGEPGEYLGGDPKFLVDDVANERFLELGAWKDQSESHEPDVTASSTNLYTDRAKIFEIYNGPLADSKFWYHAELFDTARLTNLAATVTAPALSQTLKNFKNPALLCYYLFYPAHEQSVGADGCPNVEAKELACHAGDWHCVALLLEGDGTTSLDGYTPQFFGITGSRPTPVMTSGAESYRPYSFDAEGRTSMKVEAWRSGSLDVPVQPDVVGDHPRLYVARGSHSMYTTRGTQAVSPFDDATSPYGCGKFDTPSAIPPPPAPSGGLTIDQESALIVVVKTILGGLLHSIGLGYIAGLIEATVHASQPFGADPGPPRVDPPNADAGPATAGDGTTVRPKDLEIPGLSGTPENWHSDQGVQSADGRKYNFIVDRTQQVWWPSDDGRSGYRGRWGQRVTSDPLPHRAGVRFPEFWKMFLTALEQGFGDGSLTRPHP